MNTSTIPLERSPVQSVSTRLSRLLHFANRASVAYVMLFLLQLGAIRGIWHAKDITYGDTSSYYLIACFWTEQFVVNLAWSPIYTSFLGSFLFLTADPEQAILWHRLVIVFSASMLVLAVMRRLLPPAWAWLMAAWWTVLPINFNTLYEVHLFALLPLLVVWLLLAESARWTRGAALSVLAVSVLLIRNEMSVALVILTLVCLIYEWVGLRRAKQQWKQHLKPLCASYGIPLLVAAGVCCFFWSRSTHTYAELQADFHGKHTLNMTQVYAFGYQQRHPEWSQSPWLDSHVLAEEHFGNPAPTLREMIAGNPRAVVEHFGWNLSLTLNGVQILLFNATSGATNPDYAPVNLNQRWVWIPTALVLLCWTAGLVVLVRNWRFWWRAWFKRRGFVWAGMLAVATVAPLVICTQRPRPSYLFGLSVFLMACTGMSLFILARHLRLRREVARLLPLGMVLLVGAVWLSPKLFPFSHKKHAHRPLSASLQRLKPYKHLYEDTRTVIVQGDYSYEISAYSGRGRAVAHSYDELKQGWQKGVPLETYLSERGVNALYCDEKLLTWLQRERAEEAQAFLGEQPPPGWQLLGSGNARGERWRLYQRPTSQ